MSGDEPEPILQFFAYAHLPEALQVVSMRFYDLAQHMIIALPRNPERTVALRKLLESKDAAVRAKLYKDAPRPRPPPAPPHIVPGAA